LRRATALNEQDADMPRTQIILRVYPAQFTNQILFNFN
jgi:hypothetical protein